MTPIRIELLGPLRITFGQDLLTSINTNRMRSLLAFLILNSGLVESRERLAFLLWPESSESQARTNLRQILHHLRRALPVECSLLITENQMVQWRSDASCTIDVVEFIACANRGAEAEKERDLPGACEAFEQAALLYQDDLLPDLYDSWLRTRRDQLRQQFAEVLNRLTALLEMRGDYAAAIRYATRLVALDPLSEPYYQTLIRLHIHNNDRSSALRVYHQCMRCLQRELGVTPGKTTQDLFRQALSENLLPTSAELPPYAATKPPALVGRKMEWEQLVGCWHKVAQGAAHFALVLGEPGIGKSRLAEEVFELCSRFPTHPAARARCYFAQGEFAYAPVTEWLRAEPLRLARRDLPKSRVAELTRVLPEILVEVPGIAPPQPLAESWQRLHFYEALNALFRQVHKPLLLFIDDLQWCDRDSFEWLHSLFRSGAAEGVMVLGTARLEEIVRDHPIASLLRELRQARQLSELTLAPLSEEETAALASQIATRQCDATSLSSLYQATRGNPLFVVESVRASQESQAATSFAPPRVQAVIAARLAQLSQSAYELAGLAATIGRPFSFDLLAKSSDWDENSLFRSLEELWQRRIIDGQGAGTYDYTHNLLRDVAYTELSPVRRRSWHRRIARALEELNAPDLDPVSSWLAAHYDAAGMAEEAIRHYRAAAGVAKQRFADAEAVDLIRHALDLCRDLPETTTRDRKEVELLVELGPSLVSTRGYGMQEVGETYERGLLLARRSGDRQHLFSLLSGAWAFHAVRGDLEESRKLAQSCIDDFRLEGIRALELAGHFLLGSNLFHLGQFHESREHMEQVIQSYDGPTHPALALFAGPDLRVFCRAYLSHLLWHFGRYEEAMAMSDESISLARKLSNPFSLAIALDYAALLHVFRQDPKLVLVRVEESAVICRKHGFAYYVAWAEMLAGWATAMEGDASRGLQQLREGLDALRRTGAELRLPFYYALLAEACNLAGQLNEALANIASGFGFQAKNGETWAAAELHRIHGDILAHNGDPLQAQACYRRAKQVARKIGAVQLELRAEKHLEELQSVQSNSKNAAERRRRVA